MIRRSWIVLLCCILLVSCGDDTESSKAKPRDIIDDAYTVCKAFVDSGVVSECTPGIQKIDARIDTSAGEARKYCLGLAEQIAGLTTNFGKSRVEGHEWQLRIFSPFSGEHPLATCPLY